MPVIPTDVELVAAAAATYRVDAIPAAENIDNAVRVFFSTLASGVNVIAFEGTHNVPGWLLDFFAVDSTVFSVVQLFSLLHASKHPTVNDDALGFLHAGFDAAAKSVMVQVMMLASRGPFALAGHSLGAAIALRVGAELIVTGNPPMKIGAFAPPRVGGDKFVQLVTSVPVSPPRFHNDPVPLVPFTINPAFPYRQLRLTQIGPTNDKFDLTADSDHSIANYVEAATEEPAT
jgi:predicted lipase